MWYLIARKFYQQFCIYKIQYRVIHISQNTLTARGRGLLNIIHVRNESYWVKLSTRGRGLVGGDKTGLKIANVVCEWPLQFKSVLYHISVSSLYGWTYIKLKRIKFICLDSQYTSKIVAHQKLQDKRGYANLKFFWQRLQSEI